MALLLAAHPDLVAPGGADGAHVEGIEALKSALDALAGAGLIVDDSATWCEWSVPTFRRGTLETTITLEDLPPCPS